MLKYSLLLLAPLGQLSAAVYSFDGLTPDDPLTSVPGISFSAANPASAPLAYVGLLNGSTAGALGGEFADMSADSTTLTLASSLTSSYASISFDMLIKDSTNDHPNRDIFTFTLNNGSGADLVQLRFLPIAQSLDPAGSNTDASWQVSVVAGGVVSFPTVAINELSLYSVGITFIDSDMSLTFSNSLSSTTVTQTIAGFNGATNGFGDLEFGWEKVTTPGLPVSPNGDNTMFVDNLSVIAIPEPSVALLSGLASLMLLKRRRSN